MSSLREMMKREKAQRQAVRQSRTKDKPPAPQTPAGVSDAPRAGPVVPQQPPAAATAKQDEAKLQANRVSGGLSSILGMDYGDEAADEDALAMPPPPLPPAFLAQRASAAPPAPSPPPPPAPSQPAPTASPPAVPGAMYGPQPAPAAPAHASSTGDVRVWYEDEYEIIEPDASALQASSGKDGTAEPSGAADGVGSSQGRKRERGEGEKDEQGEGGKKARVEDPAAAASDEAGVDEWEADEELDDRDAYQQEATLLHSEHEPETSAGDAQMDESEPKAGPGASEFVSLAIKAKKAAKAESPLPTGFFDDPEQDAKARGLEKPSWRRDRELESELKRFEAQMEIEQQKREWMQHRSDEEKAADDLEEQISLQKDYASRFERLQQLRAKRRGDPAHAQDSQPDKQQDRQAVAPAAPQRGPAVMQPRRADQDEDADEDDVDALLDWRKKLV
ncbi:unnamed protein product [Vitrella brassicaformis CCMP3155]|uniref:ZNF380 coiled-coil domain-containing protein n=1 Tax=Vitrella brassicaformis (strain CCMP3155) TaxID=1169540 RepID=A0A0G4G7B2_VITBC|nr:unnamed protein product [Vitrella brassicaformis CCMP3155]|eukprot:CEM24433.1 unnamed protein product [Vitrella brassicaformis CCMP3155]